MQLKMEVIKKLNSFHTAMKCSGQSPILNKRNSYYYHTFPQNVIFWVPHQYSIAYLTFTERCWSPKTEQLWFLFFTNGGVCGRTPRGCGELEKTEEVQGTNMCIKGGPRGTWPETQSVS